MFMNVKKKSQNITLNYNNEFCFELWARTQGTNFVVDV